MKHLLDSKEQNNEEVVYKPLRQKVYIFFFVSIFAFSYFASALISELLQSENKGITESVSNELSLFYSSLFSDGGFTLRVIFNVVFLMYILGYFLFIRRMEKKGKFIDKESTLKKKLASSIKGANEKVTTM